MLNGGRQQPWRCADASEGTSEHRGFKPLCAGRRAPAGVSRVPASRSRGRAVRTPGGRERRIHGCNKPNFGREPHGICTPHAPRADATAARLK